MEKARRVCPGSHLWMHLIRGCQTPRDKSRATRPRPDGRGPNPALYLCTGLNKINQKTDVERPSVVQPADAAVDSPMCTLL